MEIHYDLLRWNVEFVEIHSDLLRWNLETGQSLRESLLHLRHFSILTNFQNFQNCNPSIMMSGKRDL